MNVKSANNKKRSEKKLEKLVTNSPTYSNYRAAWNADTV